MSAPPESGRKTAAIFDLDGTITRRDTYVAYLTGFLRRNPGRAVRSAWLPLAVGLHLLGLRDNAWLKQTFLRAIMSGASEYDIAEWTKLFVAQLLRTGIRPGALAAIRRHREAQHRLILLTASFDFYAREIARELGIETLICTRSSWDEKNRLKGLIDGRNCHGPEKLERLAAYFGATRNQWHLIAYSDHHSDGPLLARVDHAVAVNATRRLQAAAKLHGYELQDWDSESRPAPVRVSAL